MDPKECVIGGVFRAVRESKGCVAYSSTGLEIKKSLVPGADRAMDLLALCNEPRESGVLGYGRDNRKFQGHGIHFLSPGTLGNVLKKKKNKKLRFEPAGWAESGQTRPSNLGRHNTRDTTKVDHKDHASCAPYHFSSWKSHRNCEIGAAVLSHQRGVIQNVYEHR
ncbi:hypothetical protein FISHEDRAFT_57571 [Fistulina hepatica ATCC 64428]|uniref:Uncharacterized protein n=1 Tax=Fistulina hepatica ATCC 64428 TaxID=1128425 RepID=A0A0D7AIT3_9AGAR|nr:hypothetical protein FISHEDRAFT_57571 [Fistulina hepatica ATCC 64428]